MLYFYGLDYVQQFYKFANIFLKLSLLCNGCG